MKTKQVRSFKEIYGAYPSREFILDIRELSIKAELMAKVHRSDCIDSEDGIHHKYIEPTSKAIDFWSKLNKRCQEWLKENDKEETK